MCDVVLVFSSRKDSCAVIQYSSLRYQLVKFTEFRLIEL